MKRSMNAVLKIIGLGLGSFILFSCSLFGGGPFTISGNVSGLQGTAILALNDGQEFVLTGNGPFNFTADFNSNIEYEISVLTWPAVQGWDIANASISEDGTEISEIQLDFFYLYFFGANDGLEVALWKSDGTPEGTEKIKAFSWLSMGYNNEFREIAYLGDEVFSGGMMEPVQNCGKAMERRPGPFP